MVVPQMEKMIDADLVGIGKLLKQTRFSVPTHQRPYAWLEGQVTDLYRDINDALKRNKEEYFLVIDPRKKSGKFNRPIINFI